MDGLWLCLSATMADFSSCKEIAWTAKPLIFNMEVFTEKKMAGPCFRG